MPELAEVEFYRRVWNAGLGQRVLAVELNATKRVFRGIDTPRLRHGLAGSVFESSFAHGKQMLFKFSGGWLGIHLGMTGELRAEAADFTPGKHDHLLLRLKERSLVFADPRLFGRVGFDAAAEMPGWWRDLPPALDSEAFTLDRVASVLRRRRAAPIKAVLLMQAFFPGVGNWMADDILWRGRIHPATAAGAIDDASVERLFHESRTVAACAVESIAGAKGASFGDPPEGWLFHARWRKGGDCPRCGSALERAEIGGRTTAWCGGCQAADL